MSTERTARIDGDKIYLVSADGQEEEVGQILPPSTADYSEGDNILPSGYVTDEHTARRALMLCGMEPLPAALELRRILIGALTGLTTTERPLNKASAELERLGVSPGLTELPMSFRCLLERLESVRTPASAAIIFGKRGVSAWLILGELYPEMVRLEEIDRLISFRTAKPNDTVDIIFVTTGRRNDHDKT